MGVVSGCELERTKYISAQEARLSGWALHDPPLTPSPDPQHKESRSVVHAGAECEALPGHICFTVDSTGAVRPRANLHVEECMHPGWNLGVWTHLINSPISKRKGTEFIAAWWCGGECIGEKCGWVPLAP